MKGSKNDRKKDYTKRMTSEKMAGAASGGMRLMLRAKRDNAVIASEFM